MKITGIIKKQHLLNAFMLLSLFMYIVIALVSCEVESVNIIKVDLCAERVTTKSISASLDSDFKLADYPHYIYQATCSSHREAVGETPKGKFAELTVDNDNEGHLYLEQGQWIFHIKCLSDEQYKKLTKDNGYIDESSFAEGGILYGEGIPSGSSAPTYINLNNDLITVTVGMGTSSSSDDFPYGIVKFDSYKVDLNGYSTLTFQYLFYKYNETTKAFDETDPISPYDSSIKDESVSRYRVLSGEGKLNPGKYILKLDIIDPASTTNAVKFSELLGFSVFSGKVTIISGICNSLDKPTQDINWIPTIEQTEDVQGDKTHELSGTSANTVDIKDNSIYNMQPDGDTGDAKDTTTLDAKEDTDYRILAPADGVEAFGINLNGKTVVVERDTSIIKGNNAGQNTTVIDLRYDGANDKKIRTTPVEFTLYNYANPAHTGIWGEFPTTNSIRVEPSIWLGTKSIFNCSPDGLSNASIIIKGPNKDNGSWSKNDGFGAKTNDHTKLGVINFANTGGTVNLSNDVTLSAVKGITCSKQVAGKTSFLDLGSSLDSSAVLNVYLSKGARIQAEGDNDATNKNLTKNDFAAGILFDAKDDTNINIGIYGDSATKYTEISAVSGASYGNYGTAVLDRSSFGIFINKGKDINITLEGYSKILATSPNQNGYGIYLCSPASSGTKRIHIAENSIIDTTGSNTTKRGYGIFVEYPSNSNNTIINIEDLKSFDNCAYVIGLKNQKVTNGTATVASVTLICGNKQIVLSGNSGSETITSFTKNQIVEWLNK